MAARHRKGRASGGIAVAAGGNPNVLKEARERKAGGKVMGKIAGPFSRHRLDKPGRKTGGRVGADKSPLSSAHSDSSAPSAPRTQQGGASHD